MIIHIVQSGETIQSISEKYQLPARKIIEQNGITNENDLVVGQTIVIIYPKVVHTVRVGETLSSIAALYQVEIMQLLRNNPNLSDFGLIPGEVIIISFDTQKVRTVAITGYAYPYIDRSILKKTLPYLSYLTVFNYMVTKEGNLNDIDDEEIIQIAKSYGVAPLMFISVISETGIGQSDISYLIMSDETLQDTLINNIVNTVRKKGYSGINQYFQYLTQDNLILVENYIKKLSDRLHQEGYRFAVTVTPRVRTERTEESTLEKVDYTKIGQYVDAMLIMSYEWGFSYGPPASVTPVNIVREVLDYVVQVVPPEKLYIGMPIVAYNWELPYIPGASRASALTTTAAIELAVVHGVSISYNEISQAPYYFYYLENRELHIVWFKDARSIDAITDLVVEYNTQGISIWNVMQFFTQMWFIINNKFDIEKVPNLIR